MTHPVQPAGFDHIVLRVVDKEKMVAFYRDVLGCPVDWDRPELGMTHVRVGSSLIDLVTVDGKLGRAGSSGVRVGVSDGATVLVGMAAAVWVICT